MVSSRIVGKKRVWRVQLWPWHFSFWFGPWGTYRSGFTRESVAGQPFAGSGALSFVAFTAMRQHALIEWRVFQWLRRLVVAPGGKDWPNQDHPPTHLFWRRWHSPFSARQHICYYCGLRGYGGG